MTSEWHTTSTRSSRAKASSSVRGAPAGSLSSPLPPSDAGHRVSGGVDAEAPACHAVSAVEQTYEPLFSRADQSCRVRFASSLLCIGHIVSFHLSFLKPICSACSLKLCLLIMSSYFLINPLFWFVTRQARESLPYFLGWECCWWGIFLRVVCFLDLLFINNFSNH